MSKGRIVIVSGPPGAGKTTVSRSLANRSPADRALHLPSDDFRGYIRKGYVDPWLPEGERQTATMMQALALAASVYAADGYEVVVDGVVSAPVLWPWRAVAKAHGIDLRYVVLAPSEAVTMARAAGRPGQYAMRDSELAQTLWRRHQDQGPLTGHVIDTSLQTEQETAAAVREALAAGRFVLT